VSFYLEKLKLIFPANLRDRGQSITTETRAGKQLVYLHAPAHLKVDKQGTWQPGKNGKHHSISKADPRLQNEQKKYLASGHTHENSHNPHHNRSYRSEHSFRRLDPRAEWRVPAVGKDSGEDACTGTAAG
jgi:hypothetical protein